MLNDLWTKLTALFKSKPDEGTAPTIGEDCPDPDLDTAREMPSKDEATEKSCTLLKIKF
jgi:hypothetical protein